MTDQKQCAKLKNIKCFLFDMDGTINLGNTLITGMDVFFQKLRAAERDFYLVTNNSSKGHEHYVEKMGRIINTNAETCPGIGSPCWNA